MYYCPARAELAHPRPRGGVQPLGKGLSWEWAEGGAKREARASERERRAAQAEREENRREERRTGPETELLDAELDCQRTPRHVDMRLAGMRSCGRTRAVLSRVGVMVCLCVPAAASAAAPRGGGLSQ